MSFSHKSSDSLQTGCLVSNFPHKDIHHIHYQSMKRQTSDVLTTWSCTALQAEAKKTLLVRDEERISHDALHKLGLFISLWFLMHGEQCLRVPQIYIHISCGKGPSLVFCSVETMLNWMSCGIILPCKWFNLRGMLMQQLPHFFF